MKFKDRVVIVTGASSGIGEVTARRFVEEGASVVITYKQNKAGADKVAQEFSDKIFVQQADLTKDGDAKMVVDFTMEKFGRVDILVNNAGRYIDGDEWDGSADVWIKSLEQNLVSAMSVSKYAIEVFQKQKFGVIVSVASRYAVSGQFDSLSYSAAKAGIVNITQAYAKLLAPYGRANSVSPGPVNCGYWLTAPKEELEETIARMPGKRLIEVSEVVDAILSLASNDKVNGENLVIDGAGDLC